jgi:putative MATE family efflux protein
MMELDPAVEISPEQGGTMPMLEGSSVLGAILRLAVPTVVALILHSLLLAEEAALLGKLSSVKLAGAALVFPWLMLMGMMSAGGLGGGVSSAIARSLGAGKHREVVELIGHSVLLAGIVGGILSVVLGIFGRAIFAWQGGTGDVLEAASTYGVITMAGGAFMWTANILTSVFRGLGNTMLPSRCNAVVALVIACVIPPVVLGWGPIPSCGLAGAAWVMVLYYFLLTLVLTWELMRHEVGKAGQARAWTFSWRHTGEILHIGVPSAFNTLLSAGIQLLATAVAAHISDAALAAYGAVSRIEGLLLPFVFGVGSALVPLVGMNVGAGQWGQVRRLAWTGAGVAFAMTGVVGLFMWIFPVTTIRIFTQDPAAVAAGVNYLRHSAWAYGFWGLGIGMTFSSQGARRPITSLGAAMVRCLYVGAGGWWLLRPPGHGTGALGLLMGSSAIVFGVAAVALAGPLQPTWMRRRGAKDEGIATG